MFLDTQLKNPSPEGVSKNHFSSGSDLAPQLAAMNALALRSLADLFSEKEKLFLRSVTLRDNRVYREQSSPKRTIIALLGLNRLVDPSMNRMFDIRSMHEAVFCDTSWVKSLRELGLLTWFTAECAPERLGKLFKEFEFDKALGSYQDGREAHTSGLAWFLAGISHSRLADSGKVPDLTDLAVDTYHLLIENQGEGGIFGQVAFPRWYRWDLYRRLGTFGDQIYAIYALSTFARAFHIEEPLAPALSCGHAIRALQGENGEWWFLYDKQMDRVVNRYPIFSWQQDGTAPVGLLALGEATGQSFLEPIRKGLSWSTRSTEFRNTTELQAHRQGLSWDSVHPKSRTIKYCEAALSLLNISRKPQEKPLCVRYATRPDHFGWMLYAFGRIGLPKEPSIAGAMRAKSRRGKRLG